jgi:prepilin-type N-terminal cleavage/methylation domain-containing protein
MHRKSAFTLIELLVVIAIIAILAAILFPVFAQARDKARQVSCLSNAKQMGIGIIQYIQDYDELLPLNAAEFPGEQYIYDYTWVAAVQPYVKNLDVFICPNKKSMTLSAADVVPSTDITKSGAATLSRPQGGPIVSFAMTSRTGYWLGAFDKGQAAFYRNEYNGRLALYDGVGGYAADPRSPQTCGGPTYAYPSLGLAGIARPAETILLQESSRYDNGGCTGFIAFPRTRHNGGVGMSPVPGMGTIGLGFATCMFVDGHAKALRGEQIYDIVADPGGNYYRYHYPAQ